ncbi:MAG TPA: hypothetical protein VFB54_05875 [Burkholderiales bacterium]|nr:hypothetical protein [Burkholderiales bacterium]
MDTTVTGTPTLISRTTSALQSLVKMWEQDIPMEEGDNDEDLLVMLSGMVGSYATRVDE